ncbi:hypothetical protein G3G77_004764 [Salmonella enterica]|nr:hypothetical protein [Salmonella enterica]EEH5466696.1 hypothetical protein [Salmonella enterica]EEH7556016.1 hypothetical protein [Salmonella enterica]EEO5640213.1 hypothetical protein [Salmonella enterica]EEQ0204185.1 hypothetical protein [Salmonella enterica]
MAISKADVANACNKLYVEGKNVTLDAVRAITGGSFSTISPLVKEWKSEQSGVNASLESSVARSDVPEKLTELLNTLWTAALATASQKMESERKLLNDYKIELENERSDVMFAADRISTELDDLKFDFSCLNTKYESVKESRDKLEHENVTLRAELAARDKSISHNESVLGEITLFLKALNQSTVTTATESKPENKGTSANAETSNNTVNSDTVIKHEEKQKAQPANKLTSESESKSENKTAIKKNAEAGNASSASVPVRGKTLADNTGKQPANSAM